MKKLHLRIDLFGQPRVICGRNIARPGKNQVQPETWTDQTEQVRCAWCLKEMAKQRHELTPEQTRLIAKSTRPRGKNVIEDQMLDEEFEEDDES